MSSHTISSAIKDCRPLVERWRADRSLDLVLRVGRWGLSIEHEKLDFTPGIDEENFSRLLWLLENCEDEDWRQEHGTRPSTYIHFFYHDPQDSKVTYIRADKKLPQDLLFMNFRGVLKEDVKNILCLERPYSLRLDSTTSSVIDGNTFAGKMIKMLPVMIRIFKQVSFVFRNSYRYILSRGKELIEGKGPLCLEDTCNKGKEYFTVDISLLRDPLMLERKNDVQLAADLLAKGLQIVSGLGLYKQQESYSALPFTTWTSLTQSLPRAPCLGRGRSIYKRKRISSEDGPMEKKAYI